MCEPFCEKGEVGAILKFKRGTDREYRALFGITEERLARRHKELVIMHPGPMNRGVEIDDRVADSDQAIILDQVLNGVASRMSILYLLLGTKEKVDEK